MGVVPSAVAALDAHREIAEVVTNGIGFLLNLAMARENKVMVGVVVGARVGLGLALFFCCVLLRWLSSMC